MSLRNVFGEWKCAAVLVCSVAVAIESSAAAPPTYRVDVLGSNIQAFAMNERGDVAGRALDAAQIGKAFVIRDGGSLELLPLPAPWISSDAYAINLHGVVVGAVSTISIASVGSHAAAWYPTESGYEFVLLGALPGHEFSTATDVNDLGDIVGGSGGLGLGMYNSAVLFAPGGPSVLPGLTLPGGVNNQRVVVASNQLLDLNTMTSTSVALPPGNWQGMTSNDINNNNGICGHIIGYSGCSTFPVRKLEGGAVEIIGGCATTTSAVSMNDQGDALTFVYNGGVGCVFIDGGYTNISGLIHPSQGQWVITSVGTINNARQLLVGGKKYPELIGQVIRLTPIGPGDLNNDGRVDGADLGMLLAGWGASGHPADLDGNGTVNGADLGMLLSMWSP
ncbi:MAG: hypothetical protein JNK53_06140 [Phycisphaerae bacterium]|nr:hypothetical protein [Phycisphaerae bacterium]